MSSLSKDFSIVKGRRILDIQFVYYCVLCSSFIYCMTVIALTESGKGRENMQTVLHACPNGDLFICVCTWCLMLSASEQPSVCIVFV